MKRYEQLTPIALHFKSEEKKEKLQVAVWPQTNLSNVEEMHRMINIRGNHKIDYDGYLALLRHAAQTYDSEQARIGNPKYRMNKHIFTTDYVDNGADMFLDAWNTNAYPKEEIQFSATTQYNNNSHAQYLQNVTRLDQQPIQDRPKIKQEIWDQLELEQKLWYCGQDKEFIDKAVAQPNRQQRAQQSLMLPAQTEPNTQLAQQRIKP